MDDSEIKVISFLLADCYNLATFEKCKSSIINIDEELDKEDYSRFNYNSIEEIALNFGGTFR